METELTVSENGFPGIYYPGDKYPDRAVIYAGGGGSSKEESIASAAFIKDAGFSMLLLGWYKWENTPKELRKVPVDYAEKAVRWLKEVQAGQKIIMAGPSEGAVYTLLAASLIPDINAVAAVSPLDYVTSAPLEKDNGMAVFTWHDEELPYTPADVSERGMFSLVRDARRDKKYGIKRLSRYVYDTTAVNEASRICVENSKAALYLMAPQDDDIWPSDEAVVRIAKKLKRCGYEYPVQTKIYDRASHMIGGDFDKLSGLGMAMFRHFIRSESLYHEECQKARTECMSDMLKFFAEV